MIEERLRLLCEGAKEKLPVRRITRKSGEPYLDRYYLLGRPPKYFSEDVKPVLGFLPFTVFLHHFLSSDEEAHHHNHPWDVSRSLILSGSYTEERLVMHDDGTRHVVWRHLIPGDVNTIHANDFHRVDLNTPEVWTLFVTGTKAQTWGFMHPLIGKFENWKEFVARGRTAPHSNPVDEMVAKIEEMRGIPMKSDRDFDGDMSFLRDHTYG